MLISPKALRAIALVSGIFIAMVSFLLIINFLQTRSADPLNSPVLTALMQDLEQNPQDEQLKEQIRALDLLARKAYFTHQWQLRTGSFLLFVAAVIMFIALKTLATLEKGEDTMSITSSRDIWIAKTKARNYIIGGLLALMIVALFAGLVSHSEISASASLTGAGAVSNRTGTVDEEAIRKNWPNFRGPFGLAKAYYTDAPISWNGESGQNIGWKVEVPKPGFNSPILWQDRLFLSGVDTSGQEVYCFDKHSGELLWQKPVENIPGSPAEPPDVSEDTGLAAPTMATDGQAVYAIFATGDIAGFDFSGNQIWARNLGLPDNHYGYSSSLLTYDNRIFVQYDHFKGRHLFALDAKTGETLWQTPRNVEISWASPILIHFESKPQVVLNASPLVAGYDALTGEELWQMKCMSAEVGPSCAYADGIVFAANEYAVLVAIQLGDEPAIIWEYDEDLPEASSPLATGDFLIMASGYGTVSCLDARTGERYWMKEFDAVFYSSPVLVGDKVYLLGNNGVMFIFKAAKIYEDVGTAVLGEPSMCCPVFNEDHIYIRGEKYLYCIAEG